MLGTALLGKRATKVSKHTIISPIPDRFILTGLCIYLIFTFASFVFHFAVCQKETIHRGGNQR